MKKIAIFGDSLLKGITLDEHLHYINYKDIPWQSLEKKYQLKIDNYARMGATITYGIKQISKFIDADSYDTVLLEFGGNDCDYDWAKISTIRSKDHQPKTPVDEFKRKLEDAIQMIKKRNIKPILVTLPPIHSKMYFDWFTRDGINKENIMYFLGDLEVIYRHQERYNMVILEVAREEEVEIIDIRMHLLSQPNYQNYMAKDGIHLNENGIKQVVHAFELHLASIAD